jgi:hypothetical protein
MRGGENEKLAGTNRRREISGRKTAALGGVFHRAEKEELFLPALLVRTNFQLQRGLLEVISFYRLEAVFDR